MKLFIVGATGRTGRLVIEQAISRGHTITAIVRRPGMLHAHERLQIVVGDPLRCSILAPALVGHDAVISCIGQRAQQDANLLTRAATSILKAMSESQVRRCLVVSQGLLFPSWNPIVMFLRLALKRNVAELGRHGARNLREQNRLDYSSSAQIAGRRHSAWVSRRSPSFSGL